MELNTTEIRNNFKRKNSAERIQMLISVKKEGSKQNSADKK